MSKLLSKYDILDAFTQSSIDALYDSNWELFNELNDDGDGCVFTKGEFFQMAAALNE